MVEDLKQREAGGLPAGDVSRVQDVVVTMIIALIGTAVALGLTFHAGFAVVPAMSVGAGLFVWLLSAHFLITRMRLKRLIDHRLGQLSHDVSILKKEAEITDLLAEGHNELLENQDGIEKAIQTIAQRMDGYDQRLKALYKLGKKNSAQLEARGQDGTEAGRFDDLQQELGVLSREIEAFDQRFKDQAGIHSGLVKAELDLLAFIVGRILTSEGDERSHLSQKALAVIEGLRQLPVIQAQGTAASQIQGLDLLRINQGDEAALQGRDALGARAQEAQSQEAHSQEAQSGPLVSDRGGNDGAAGSAIGIEAVGRAAPAEMASLSQEALLGAINEAIEANRIELFMQPIVGLPERDLVYYEAFPRLRNDLGQLMVPEDFLPTAEMAGLAPLIDNQIILRTIQVVQRLVANGKSKLLFCNLSLSSLRDGDFFAEFMDFMEANKWLSSHIVFEFNQSAVDEAGPFEYERLQAIAQLGFAFSLDEVSRLNLDFKALADMNFRFIKVSASLLLGNVTSARAEIHPADLGPYLDRLNLTMIVDHVEREAVVRQLRDYQVNFAQGVCFCEPRPVRADVLTAPAAHVA